MIIEWIFHKYLGFVQLNYFLDRMKMEQKKVQEKAKREHRRVMMAVDEFLKVEIKMID